MPLAKLLRQGQPSRVLAQELDLYEPNLNKWVGTLQVLISNEGKKASNQPKHFDSPTKLRHE